LREELLSKRFKRSNIALTPTFTAAAIANRRHRHKALQYIQQLEESTAYEIQKSSDAEFMLSNGGFAWQRAATSACALPRELVKAKVTAARCKEV
jgi:hypothetical protein